MLPDLSFLWVILAVLVLAFALDRLLFRPLLRVMKERETTVKSAMELAHTAAAKAQAATAEFDAKMTAARADLYKQMDERRKAAEQYRAEVMAKTREDVDQSLAKARADLDAQATAARQQLERDADSLGREIAQKVLGRTGAILLALALASFGATAFAQTPAAPAPSEHAAAPAPDAHAAQPAAEPAPEHAAAAPADAHAAPAAEHGGEADHGNPIFGMLAKLINFGILAGTLVYFLRSPLATYLVNRGKQIRADLVKAAEMKTAAAAQLAAVDAKLAALPGELDALRRTGADEVAAEEARMREAADKERERLLVQMRREIELHGKAAERDLLRAAVSKAVDVATAEVTRTMTPADHARLVERYVGAVGR